jgi:hypothetical protein
MPRIPGEIHTNIALDYKKQQEGQISKDLGSALNVYGKNLAPTERDHIKTALEKRIAEAITQYEQAYLVTRTRRGEKITRQDMDDFMPYVHMAMLKELYVQIGDRNTE